MLTIRKIFINILKAIRFWLHLKKNKTQANFFYGFVFRFKKIVTMYFLTCKIFVLLVFFQKNAIYKTFLGWYAWATILQLSIKGRWHWACLLHNRSYTLLRKLLDGKQQFHDVPRSRFREGENLRFNFQSLKDIKTHAVKVNQTYAHSSHET